MDLNLESSGTSRPVEKQQEDVPLIELMKTDAPSAQSSADPSYSSESVPVHSKDESPQVANPTEIQELGLPTLEGTSLEAPPKTCSENSTQDSEPNLSDSKNDVVCTIKPNEPKEVEVPLLETTVSEVLPVATSIGPSESVRRRRWRHRYRPRRRPPRATKKILAILCLVTILAMIAVGIYFIVRHLERPIEKKNLIPTGGNPPTTNCNATDREFSSTAPITVSFRVNSENLLLEIHNHSWQGWLPVCGTKWNSSLGELMCRYMGHIKYLSSNVVSVSEIERNYAQGFAEITNGQDSNLENIWGYRTNCTSGKVVKLKCSACGERHDFSMIVGGQDATLGSWPWQVTLYYNYQHTCGGSILDEYWLITAAHCVHRLSIAHNWRVYAGIVDRQIILFTSIPTYVVDKIIYHNDYNDDTHDYDIALMKLRKPITFTDTVEAICLPKYNQQIMPGKKCWITGWGQTSADADVTENVLKEASVPLISTERCNSSCMYNGAITPRMLCAGYREGKADACQGDSGGPLVCEGISAWHLTGMVSWGIGCAKANHPGVYTKISELREWIYSVIEDNSIS
ncbi:transmembrane protease serine 5-like isoform X1 [Hemitrygon akajei]|uniref:transmembrane protease serine 5-like isoform X1 n=1 Tax=Hemitrygon akajei TaxID=2704970 RepID=UPI003BF9D1FA